MKVFAKTAVISMIALGFSATGAQAQSFDYLLLAASWQPGFCVSHSTKPECQTLKGTYAASNLALHGLWPNAYDGNHPFYCNVPQKDITLDQSSQWCSMDSYGLSSSTLATLRTYMPGAGPTTSCLDDHEWYKHGSCSTQAPNNYWTAASNLMYQFGHTSFNTFLKNSAGRYVTRTQLLNAFEASFGTASRSAVSFNCTRYNNISYFTEVWVNLNKSTYTSFPNAASLVTDGAISSTCPTSSILIALAK